MKENVGCCETVWAGRGANNESGGVGCRRLSGGNDKENAG